MPTLPAGSRLVLIVEDQPEVRQLIRLTLRDEPYQLHEAADGSEGLRLAFDLVPDLILLDRSLPGAIDGLQVCRQVRGQPRLAATRVLMLSASDRPQDRVAGRQAGADGYLTKPFSPLLLVETIAQLLAAG